MVKLFHGFFMLVEPFDINFQNVIQDKQLYFHLLQLIQGFFVFFHHFFERRFNGFFRRMNCFNGFQNLIIRHIITNSQIGQARHTKPRMMIKPLFNNRFQVRIQAKTHSVRFGCHKSFLHNLFVINCNTNNDIVKYVARRKSWDGR